MTDKPSIYHVICKKCGSENCTVKYLDFTKGHILRRCILECSNCGHEIVSDRRKSEEPERKEKVIFN